MRRKDAFRPGAFDLTPLKTIRTVREFDEAYTAPYFGFRDAEDYYHRASAMRVIDRIRVPALVITADDDPFVPSQPFHDPKITGNPHIDLRMSAHGGHCGFVGAAIRGRRRLLGGEPDCRVRRISYVKPERLRADVVQSFRSDRRAGLPPSRARALRRASP